MAQAITLDDRIGGKVPHEELSSTYDSLNSPLSTSEETPEEDNAIAVEQEEPIEEQATETLDDETDDSGEDSIMPEQEPEAGAEDESSQSQYTPTNRQKKAWKDSSI